MSPDELKKLALVDLIYGVAASSVLVAGLALWFLVGTDAFYTSYVFYVECQRSERFRKFLKISTIGK